jgi:hypothetical protein
VIIDGEDDDVIFGDQGRTHTYHPGPKTVPGRVERLAEESI